MKLSYLFAVVLPLSILVAGCTDGPSLNPEATIRAFEEARNHQDLEMAMRHVDDNARFEDDGRDGVYLVEEFEDGLGWDMRLHVTSEFRLPVIEADTVVAMISETNDLRRALGAGKAIYRARYIVHKGKIVYRHLTPLTTDGAKLDDVLQAFLVWVKREHASELATIMTDGKLVRTPAAATALEELLVAYKSLADSMIGDAGGTAPLVR